MNRLRPYQRELLDEVVATLKSADKPVMMQLPTGGGKTVIAGQLLADYLHGRRKAVWLTHRRELAGQTEKLLCRWGVKAKAVGSAWKTGTKAPAIDGGIVILMVQTVGKRIEASGQAISEIVWDDYDANNLMIIDEAHHATAPSWKRAIDQWPGKVLGMTATPWRLSKKEGFDHLFSNLILGPQVRDLQEDGYLCKAVVKMPDGDDLIVGGKIGSTGDYTEKSIEEANANRDVMTARALKFWQEEAANRQTIIYAVSVRHAENLATLFRKQGFLAEAIRSKTDTETRKQTVDDFANRRIQTLINVAIATEGFDLPDASCIVIARPTKSLSLYLQMVGRGLRPKPDGGNCLILDLAGNAREHKLPEKHREWSLVARGESTRSGEAPVRVCDKCRTVSASPSHNCKSCGAPFGKDCPGCTWRAWKDWSLEECDYSHDKRGDCCHLDIHYEYGYPVDALFLRKFKGDIDSLEKGQYVLENPEIVTATLLIALREMKDSEAPLQEVIARARTILYKMDCIRLELVPNEEQLERPQGDLLNELLRESRKQTQENKASELLLKQVYGYPGQRDPVNSKSLMYKKSLQAYQQLVDDDYCTATEQVGRRRAIWGLTPAGRQKANNILLQTPNGDE